MAGKNKYYVVWKGKKPGIYETWNDCKKQIQGFEGARYMGFPDKEEAEAAYKKQSLYLSINSHKIIPIIYYSTHIDFEILGVFCDQLSKELAGFFEAKDFLSE